jgi:hypothetical protein
MEIITVIVRNVFNIKNTVSGVNAELLNVKSDNYDCALKG